MEIAERQRRSLGNQCCQALQAIPGNPALRCWRQEESEEGHPELPSKCNARLNYMITQQKNPKKNPQTKRRHKKKTNKKWY